LTIAKSIKLLFIFKKLNAILKSLKLIEIWNF